MALMSRTATAALAGVLVAVTMAAPVLARWSARGAGTGTVSTSVGTTKVITLTLAVAAGKSVRGSGNAGITNAYSATITVVLCKENTWPCPTAQIAAALTATAAAGSPSYTTSQSGNLNGVAVWGRAVQTEISGWKDYSSIAGPLTP
jgi:hypothetical protein